MKTSVTIPNLDTATANWLYAEALQRQQSVETLILAIIQKEIEAEKKAQQKQARASQVERQYAEAYGKLPVQPDEFAIDEAQLVWGDE